MKIDRTMFTNFLIKVVSGADAWKETLDKTLTTDKIPYDTF
jgi:hypothetical protein